MASVPYRRLGVALLIGATVFTMVSASAANLNLTAPGVVGAGEQTISAPCTSVTASYTQAYDSTLNAYVVNAVVLTGTGCTAATTLTVKVTLKDANSTPANPETVVDTVDPATINGGESVDVTAVPVKVSDFDGLAVLITDP
jgi:hypothetical protein